MRLTRGVLALTGRQHLTEDRLADIGLVDAGPGDDRLKNCGTQVVRRCRGKGSVEAADGSARGRHDYDIGHGKPLRQDMGAQSTAALVRRQSRLVLFP